MKAKGSFVSLLTAVVTSAVPLMANGCSEQQKPRPVVGILMYADFRQPAVDGLIDGLEELGYTAQGDEGGGGNIEYRVVNAHGDRSALPELARHLVEIPPAVLCPVGGVEARACVDAARETGVAVVFVGVSGPVKWGLARSALEPLPNTTGVETASESLIGKRMQLARLFFPQTTSAIILYNPGSVSGPESLRQATQIGPELGLTVRPVPLGSDKEVVQFMRTLTPGRNEVLLDTPSVLLFSNRKDVIAPGAIHAGIPFVGLDREGVKEGAVLAYGSDLYSVGRQGGKLVSKVLLGTRPDAMPIEMPSRIELSINFETARLLDVSFPPKTADLVDFVIE